MTREELIGRMFVYLQKYGEEWGQLHVVCADGNFEDVNLLGVGRHALNLRHSIVAADQVGLLERLVVGLADCAVPFGER